MEELEKIRADKKAAYEKKKAPDVEKRKKQVEELMAFAQKHNLVNHAEFII